MYDAVDQAKIERRQFDRRKPGTAQPFLHGMQKISFFSGISQFALANGTQILDDPLPGLTILPVAFDNNKAYGVVGIPLIRR